MHGDLVVPHHQIADAPLVPINELALRRMFGQFAHQHERFRHGPADDAARVR
jgi:hypothetical protein